MTNGMTFEERTAYHYCNGAGKCNCSETIIHAINDVLDLNLSTESLKMMGAFGGGCGVESLCGAVVSTIAAISLVNIEGEFAGKESEAIKRAALFVNAVREHCGSEMCDELRKKYHNPTDHCSIVLSRISKIIDELRPQLFEK